MSSILIKCIKYAVSQMKASGVISMNAIMELGSAPFSELECKYQHSSFCESLD